MELSTHAQCPAWDRSATPKAAASGFRPCWQWFQRRKPCWGAWRNGPCFGFRLLPTSSAINAVTANSEQRMSGCSWSSQWERLPVPVCWSTSEIAAQRCCPACRGRLATQPHLLVRAAQHRRIQAEEYAIGHLLDQRRAWPGQGQRSFEMPARHGHQARQTTLQISFGALTSVCKIWVKDRSQDTGLSDPLL